MDGYAFAGTPAERPRGIDRGRVVASVLLVAIVSASAGAGYVAATSARAWFPKAWDPGIAPIAAEVAKLRGLDFEHPVPIHYLAPKDFELRLAANDSSSATRNSDARRDEAIFRALGFVGGKDDLLAASDTAQGSSVLAYYDPDVQQIFVRGTTLDVEHRVTVAHELTHVLQDQQFDLRALQRRAARVDESDALRALVEGDAVRIQDEYLAQQAPAERAEYARENKAEGDRVRKETASVPDIVGILDGAPYELGPATIRVLLESGGNGAVNDALTGPAPSSSVFLDTGDISPPSAVDDPLPPSGAVRLAPPDSFGGFETFLMLATRLGPVDALSAADTVSGGRAITFRSNGVTCYRAVVAPATDEARPTLERAVELWARDRPHTAVDQAGDDVGFTVCDPGRDAPEPSPARLRTAFQLLELRTGITVGAAAGHTPGDVARCVARLFVRSPGAAQLLLAVGDGEPDGLQRARFRAIADTSRNACRVDPERGLA